MVGVAGFEPATTRIQGEHSTRLSYTPLEGAGSLRLLMSILSYVVPVRGIEPRTYWLQISCSAKLS